MSSPTEVSVTAETENSMASTETTEFDLTSEIKEVKQQFPGCKALENVGDFVYIVDIKKEGLDLSVKFQLEESYPTSIPGVIIKSKCLSSEEKMQLTEHLQSEAKIILGQKMLVSLYDTALLWLNDKAINVEECGIVNAVSGSPKGGKKGGKKGKKGAGGSSKNKEAQEKHERSSKKLSSMKRADDVISRIQWDDQLPTEHFVVGYLDRFVGIVERSFISFTWEDIASVDYDVLAIPKHRIHYFKYKDVKVWDKDQRLDNVFGSTGSGMTITDVIEKYEAGEIEVEQKKANDPLDDESDSDDEDIVIKTGFEADEVDENGDIVYPRDKYWGPKKRPTHFLCLRVTDPAIVKAVQKVEAHILDLEPLYEENIIPPHRLHITLACLGLDTYEEIDKATETLHKIKHELDALTPKDITISLTGVDNFFNNVLYAKVEHNSDFLAFVHKLRICVQEAGMVIRDVFEFTPHMTILKFKKQLQKEMKTRYIEPRVYEGLENTCFGQQPVDNVYLCEMSENRDEAGFYISPTHLKF